MSGPMGMAPAGTLVRQSHTRSCGACVQAPGGIGRSVRVTPRIGRIFAMRVRELGMLILACWLALRVAFGKGVTLAGLKERQASKQQCPVIGLDRRSRGRLPAGRIFQFVALVWRLPLLKKTCLMRSHVLWAVLRASGHDARLLIGVRHEERSLQAHAWVECPDGLGAGIPVQGQYVVIYDSSGGAEG